MESNAERREIHAMMLLNFFADCANRGVYGYEHPLGLIWVHPDGEFHAYLRNGNTVSGNGRDGGIDGAGAASRGEPRGGARRRRRG